MTGDNSGVRDSVVNQLLTKIDGVRERNNCLVIGMTNRVDLIDPALIRPGRLEVIIEIPEPDRDGRIEVLYIMLKPMILGNFISSIEEAKHFASKIATATAGFTGADLAGVLRSASSFALNRYYGDDTEIKITWPDIEAGLKEMKKNKKVSKRKIISETLQYHFKRVFNQSKIKKDEYRTLEQILYDN
jgi:vesicle-fusing ATPase